MDKQFLEAVLPTHGNICVMGLKDKFPKHRFSETVDDAIVNMEKFDKDDYNTFFALGTFEGYERKAEQCLYMRSFFVDLDCGAEKPYPLWEEALIALHSFVDAAELPAPIIVNSGNGIHAYWPFDTDVSAEEWKPYALKFKEYCIGSGLHIDEKVSADAARVLRVPGSRNVKDPLDPKPVTVLQRGDPPTTFSSWESRLGSIQPIFDLSKIEKGLDEDTQAIYEKQRDNFEYEFAKIAILSLEGNGCGQIKHIIENAASCPEPLWYAGISVAARCVDGATAIHQLSEDHPEYSRDATDRKAAQSLREAKWAHGCAAFESENSAGCTGCPHRGRITGPIELGKKLRVARQPTETQEETDAVRPDGSAPPPPPITFPAFLHPYARGINGGIYYTPPPKATRGGMTQDPDELITPHDLYPTHRLMSPHDGECLMMRLDLPKDASREFLLPLKDVTALDKLKATLAFNGVVFEPLQAHRLASYLMKWTSFLINTKRADIMRLQMGWTEECRSFVVGTTEYFPQDEERFCPPSSLIKNIVKHLRPSGSYDEWRNVIRMFNDPGYEFHAFALLCGIASPLMELTNVNGIILSLFSPEPGSGKSGALFGALSAWGNPKGLSLNDSTGNGLMQRMVTCKNILFGLDEQTNSDGKQVSSLAYGISAGKGKLRLQSSANQEREASLDTKLIAVITTNKRLKSTIAEYKSNHSAEDVRILECVVSKPMSPGYELTASRGVAMFQPLHIHHGHAGPIFIKRLFELGLDNVRKMVEKEYIAVGDEFSSSSEYRFLSNLFAVTRVAARICHEIDMLDFDMNRIIRVVGGEFHDIIAGKERDDSSSRADVLGDFINRNIQNSLVLRDGKVTHEPRNALYVRAEVDTGRIYISTSALKTYLREQHIDVKDFEQRLTKQKILKGHIRKQMASGWKDALGSTNVQAYEIEMDINEWLESQKHEPETSPQ